VIIAAAVCPAPPLLARELTGSDLVLPELRQACLDATAALLAADPDLVAVVGVAEQTRRFDSRAVLDLGQYAPALRAAATRPQRSDGDREQATPLPLPLGLAARLLDQAGHVASRALHSIGEQATAWECAALGAEIAIAAERVALLVMADGSARRGPKAPGHLDERSAPFDAEVERAIRAGDMAALLALDADLARELMATGRPAWQVLAGALAGRQPASGVLYSGDPFGVAYLVASLAPVAEGTSAGWQHGG
jgi:hypothetical protein